MEWLHLSPVNESKTKVKYFRGTIADQSKKVPVVSFKLKLWKRLSPSDSCLDQTTTAKYTV